MSNKWADPPLRTVDEAKIGPAMRLLNPRQREFVAYLVESGSDNETEAARRSGYKLESEGALKVQAYRLAHDPRVLAAIREECERKLKFDLPVLLSNMRSIALNPEHKQQRHALVTLMNMGGLRESSETIVTHQLDPEHLKAQIAAMFTQLKGVDLQALLPSPVVIEHEPDPEP